jgi:hypothetical protein
MPDAVSTYPVAVSRKKLLLFVLFLAITAGPLTMVHAQWLTGPLVNSMLILTCALVGPTEAVILGLFPSTVALASGLLPLPLAPMIPFILIGNALYVVTFHSFGSRNFFGIVGGSVLKFLFLALTARLIVAPLVPATIAPTLLLMMGVPQLVTALIGGAIAVALLFLLPRRARHH